MKTWDQMEAKELIGVMYVTRAFRPDKHLAVTRGATTGTDHRCQYQYLDRDLDQLLLWLVLEILIWICHREQDGARRRKSWAHCRLRSDGSSDWTEDFVFMFIFLLLFCLVILWFISFLPNWDWIAISFWVLVRQAIILKKFHFSCKREFLSREALCWVPTTNL